MYESESNPHTASQLELPLDILERFTESRSTVSRRSLIPWGEHCTECVWPTCYTTCEFYQPRVDGRCRRFEHGMVRIPCHDSLNGYLLKITFRPWAKLWSPGNIRLYSLDRAQASERRDHQLAGLVQLVPTSSLKSLVMHKRYSLKKRVAQRPAPEASSPDCLLIECFNPDVSSLAVTLVLRGKQRAIPFQALLVMEPGFNRHRIPAAEIQKSLDLRAPFDIELTPNLTRGTHTLVFGAMDFVAAQETASTSLSSVPAGTPPPQPRICKCVVWDLDNTIWDGILVEDGLDRLKLKPHLADVLKTLDERGILLSVLSKNNSGDALAALRHFGIADYFLHPQISWNPKSAGLRTIVSALNIGMDSVFFVDDSPFEREEVQSACPGVTVLDASAYLSIASRPECRAPVTEASRKRRALYREQEVRDTALTHFGGDYSAFLRDCRLRLTIGPLNESSLVRVHELTQRTNQMNFTGNRYSLAQLQAILADPRVDTYILDCEDRFGSYGTIGFCTVQHSSNCLTDLMFSCRIQAKRIEHAFLSFLLQRYRRRSGKDFCVLYRKTPRNEASGAVFADLAFDLQSEADGLSRLVFPADRPIPDDHIVAIVDLTAAAPALAESALSA
jgi:FkbH-like protein